MLMEPDIFSPSVYSTSESSYTSQNGGFKPIISTSNSPIQHSTYQNEPADTNDPAAQNYYPFYRDTSTLGHSRPYYPIQHQQPIGDFQPRYHIPRSLDSSLLGSGDFGVIRGGTFYQDNDPPFHTGESNDYYNYFLNGHGRPHSSPYFPKYHYPEEQFANFRDFADINTPNDGAFSQFVVVYANKNATTNLNHPNPKNIFEQLEMIDKEKSTENVNSENKINIKISKTKAKLEKTKKEKNYKKQLSPKSVDYEPLLALS